MGEQEVDPGLCLPVAPHEDVEDGEVGHRRHQEERRVPADGDHVRRVEAHVRRELWGNREEKGSIIN